MQRRHGMMILRAALPLGIALLVGAGRASGDVHVAVTPATLTVDGGSQFILDLTVSPAGSAFNGFDITVSYDPAALTLQPMSPLSDQEGCLMTGDCSAACGNTFHRFASAADSAAITDVLLCDQIALTGPGQIYRLRFRASTVPQVTHVRIRRARFYNQGLFVNPVTTADAEITIVAAVGVDPPIPGPGIQVRAETNPGRGAMAFTVEADAPGVQRLEIHDATGRRVRVLEDGWREAGVRHVSWDGRDEAQGRVPAGIYWVSLTSRDRMARIRVALLR